MRSPVQIRAPRLFPANRPLFALRFAVCWSPQKLNGTYHAKVRGPQKWCKSQRSTASVDTTGRIGEVHRTRTGALARKDLLIRMFSLRSSGTSLQSCAQSVPNPGERGRVKRCRALAVPEHDRQPRAGFRFLLGRGARRRPGHVSADVPFAGAASAPVSASASTRGFFGVWKYPVPESGEEHVSSRSSRSAQRGPWSCSWRGARLSKPGFRCRAKSAKEGGASGALLLARRRSAVLPRSRPITAVNSCSRFRFPG